MRYPHNRGNRSRGQPSKPQSRKGRRAPPLAVMEQARDHRQRLQGLELVREAAVRRMQACFPIAEARDDRHEVCDWLRRAINALCALPLVADGVREAWCCVLHLPTERIYEFQYARLVARELLILFLCCTRPGFVLFTDPEMVLTVIRPPRGLEFPQASAFGVGGLQGVMQALAAATRLGRAGGACPSFCRQAFHVHDVQDIAAIHTCYALVTLLSRSA